MTLCKPWPWRFAWAVVFSCFVSFQPSVAVANDGVEPPDATHPDHVSLTSPDILVPTLINGNPVSPGTWKFVVRIRTGNSSCSASVVGPRVLATAAHCAKTGATSQFTLDGVSYSARITRHPDYPGRDTDLALGVLSKEVSLSEYGTLPDSTDMAKRDMAIRLIGYGCTRPGGTGGNDGVLREGMSTIQGFNGNDIVTGKSGDAALCYGDSGGPAFIQANEKLINISQNSKGDIKVRSLLARWDSSTGQSFLRSFVSNNSVEICGINRNCTGSTPPPGGTKTFAIDGKAVGISGTIKDPLLIPHLDYIKRVFEMAVLHFDTKI